jgi:pimeloyl-ACP methyl ester carboxylesterase
MISALRRGHEGMTEKTTHVVGEGADAITYDVRGDLASATPERPVLMLFGSPMDASGFGTLAGHFTDRPVVTYDPRGSGRNPTDTAPMTPDQHAADLHRVIQALGAGPVDLFATSGGAVNALRLVETHPDDVRRLVAHEPPTAALVPDRDRVLGACEDIVATYRKAGHGPAMAKFIALVMYDGELPADYLDRPAPDPAMFGMSAEDNGSRDDPLMRNFPACNLYTPDAAALAALGDRLFVVAGKASGETMAARGARSVAAAVGIPVTEFAGDHGGFLGGEYGQTGEPDAFAADLRAALA